MLCCMEQKTGCMICGEELVYFDEVKPAKCYYCGEIFDTNAWCINEHFVCDTCHGNSANNLIERYCIQTIETDPIKMAVELMGSPLIKMHGPEHHFLVPGVLLAAYANLTSLPKQDLVKQLAQARKRAEVVPGGFCGFMGACGAAIGTGIFLRIITRSPPTSKESWGQSNLLTSESLRAIAEHGGPRCCKRDSFLALLTAVDFVHNLFDIDWQVHKPVTCKFSGLNKECLYQDCPFFPKRNLES